MTFLVGQAVFVQVTHGRVARLLQRTIKAVGRTWGTLDNGRRFDLKTRFIVHSGQYVYLSREEYQEQLLHSMTWRAFRERVLQTQRSQASTKEIELAAKLLGYQLWPKDMKKEVERETEADDV